MEYIFLILLWQLGTYIFDNCHPVVRIHSLTHGVCPPNKNRHKIALKNGMNRNNFFIFVEVVAFIPRLACGRPLPIRLKGERTKQPHGQFASAQAYHIGSSLSSDVSTINNKPLLVRYWRQPIKSRLRAHGIVIRFDIWKYINLRFNSCSIVLVMNKFTFKTAEKFSATALSYGSPFPDMLWLMLCFANASRYPKEAYCTPRSLWKIKSSCVFLAVYCHFKSGNREIGINVVWKGIADDFLKA